MIWDFGNIAVTLLIGTCCRSYCAHPLQCAGFSNVGAALCSFRHSNKWQNSRLLIHEHVIIWKLCSCIC